MNTSPEEPKNSEVSPSHDEPQPSPAGPTTTVPKPERPEHRSPDANRIEHQGSPSAARTERASILAHIPMHTRIKLAVSLGTTGLSLPLTVWAARDLAGALIGIPLGLFLDLIVVAAVAIAWWRPTKPARVLALAVAALAVVLVGYHGLGLGAVLVLLGGVPALSATLWHLVLVQRAAQIADREAADQARRKEAERVAQAERAEAARIAKEMADALAEQAVRKKKLSPDMTEEQLAVVAEGWRDLETRKALAELAEAKAQQEHAERLAKARRVRIEAEAEHEEEIAAIKRRADRERAERVETLWAHRLSTVVEITDMGTVPDSPAALEGSTNRTAGFGAALNQAASRVPERGVRVNQKSFTRSRPVNTGESTPAPPSNSGEPTPVNTAEPTPNRVNESVHPMMFTSTTKKEKIIEALEAGFTGTTQISQMVGCAKSMVSKIKSERADQ